MTLFQTIVFWLGAMCMALSAGIFTAILYFRVSEWWLDRRADRLLVRRMREQEERIRRDDERFCRGAGIDHTTAPQFLGRRA
jgi:hypothetical protein